MNEQTQAELLEWIRRGGEFVEREVPLYAAECVSWYFWQGVVGVATGFLAVSLGAIGVRWSIKTLRNCRSDDMSAGVALGGCIACPAAMILGLIIAPLALCDCIKAKVAPRVVVMESLAKSLK